MTHTPETGAVNRLFSGIVFFSADFSFRVRPEWKLSVPVNTHGWNY